MSAFQRSASTPAVGAAMTRWATARAWAGDALGLVALGLAIPIAILVLGSPIALAVRLVLELYSRF